VTKQVAVIGGGIAGLCTAFFLADSGHDVVVIERHQNVAQESSFANSGLVAPAYSAPWAAPGMPRKMLASLFQSESPVILKPGLNRSLWRWIRRWVDECEIERYRINKTRMQRVGMYSHDLLRRLRDFYQLDYEQTQGMLQLFRSDKDLQLAEAAIALLAESGVPHQLLDREGARAIEPALASDTPLAGALHLPQDEAGNCPLFAKRLKQIAADIGVQFHFGGQVQTIEQETHGIALLIDGQRFVADAVVIAAGADSARLLQQLGIRLPLYPVKVYAATAHIRNYDNAPKAALADAAYKVEIARLGSRIRLSGVAELGNTDSSLKERALRTLIKTGSDWFPNAARYAQGNFWCGVRLMLPDAVPLLGPTPLRNVYLNIAHGLSGWTMAAGAGKIVSDIISGQAPDIDMDGLTMARYG
jgi:D-amino-acid dehydrogenase